MRLLTKGLSSGSAIGLLTNGLLLGGLSVPVEEFQYPAGIAYLRPYPIAGDVVLLPYSIAGEGYYCPIRSVVRRFCARSNLG
jgi:hypothetical protein